MGKRGPKPRRNAQRIADLKGQNPPLRTADFQDTTVSPKSMQILSEYLPLKVTASTVASYASAKERLTKFAEGRGMSSCWKDHNMLIEVCDEWIKAGQGPSTVVMALKHERFTTLSESRASAHPAVLRFVEAFEHEWERNEELTRPPISRTQLGELKRWIKDEPKIHDKEHFELVVDLMWTFALRIGDIKLLRPEDCRPKESAIYLRHDKITKRRKLVHISFLRKDRKECKRVAKAASKLKQDTVQFNNQGELVSYDFIDKMLKKAQSDLGFTFPEGTTGKLCTHSFRHGRAVDLLSRNVRREEVRNFARMNDDTLTRYQFH
eukprot:gene9693-3072_t